MSIMAMTDSISHMDLPESIDSESALDEYLTRPSPALVEHIRTLKGPLVILGAGGKMGPTLAVLARRAAQQAGCRLEVCAISRFSQPAARDWLDQHDVQTLSVDLLDEGSKPLLPDASDVIYLVGGKFGTADNPARTWAVNTAIPAWVAPRYAAARMVALSTGNVYPLTPAERGGSIEQDPVAPVGEYAASCVGRERIFEFHSRERGLAVALIRLNYAVELRYGVLVDLAAQVLAGRPVDLRMGHFNCIWQGDANDMILRALSLAASPPSIYNLTGPATLSVREIATRLGQLLERPVEFLHQESATALLSNAAAISRALGPPPTPLEAVLRWIARWLARGGRRWNKPTHFEVRDGRF